MERANGKAEFCPRLEALCADSRDLIDQSGTLISGSDAACAGFMDQIEKTKEAVTKSRKQISRLR
jgi:hypothetical protein